MKQLKDYLHLYLGCEVETNIPAGFMQNYGNITMRELTPENLSIVIEFIGRQGRYKNEGFNDYDNFYIKPILRPLSDMTEEERKEYAWIGDADFNEEFEKDLRNDPHSDSAWIKAEARQNLYLLSKHFDLFNLHDEGLCLYKNGKGELY